MVLITALLTLALSGPTQPPQAASPSDPPEQQAEPQVPRAEPQEQKAEPKEQKAEAQEPPTPPHTGIRALFGNLGEDIKHLPAMQNVYIAAVGGGLALAAHPGDQAFNAKLLSHYDAVNTAFAPGKYLGNTPEQVAFSLSTYAFGRLRDQPKVAHLGMDLLQAQILSEILVEPLKFAVRRERPDGSNNLSFPSGHAAVTFATATVIERHLGWRKSLLGYAIASYVAMSRIHDNQHYLSDVIFGAAVGTIAGRTVVHHQADYWAFTPVAMPGGGVALMISRTKWDR
jgi:membrane-associated phospholipid phosphatase